MNVFFMIFLLVSAAVCGAELLEATEGENVTISLKTDELERVDQVMATFTRENQTNLIARFCYCTLCGDCDDVETPGVFLRVEEGTLTLPFIKSIRSGLYKVKIIGNKVYERNVTLVVKKPAFPPHFTPKPPNTPEQHQLHWTLLYWILGIIIFIIIIIFGGIIYVYRQKFCCRSREPQQNHNEEPGIPLRNMA